MDGSHQYHSRSRLVALVAAHNEERQIGAAIQSLLDQTRRPDEIVIVADRCVDRTIEIALRFGASVIESVGNVHRKAGALNQALARILPTLDADDLVIMMDADTELNFEFLEAAERRLRTHEDSRPTVGAVGSVFLAIYPVTKIVEAVQRNEYLRYAHDLKRRKGRAEVISGTAGMYPVAVLRQVAAERGSRLPASGFIYDNTALTEDNELTMAVKHLGYRCASPTECTVRTELMPTVRTLYFQRLRWQRGALENLRTYGLTKYTLPYILRQMAIYLGILFLPYFVAVVVIAILQTERFPWSWPWFFISSILVIERVWTVRRGGRRAVILSALILPEITYDVFLHFVFTIALADAVTGTRASWDHREAVQQEVAGLITQAVRTIVQIAVPICGLVLAAFLALLTTQLGVQWVVVGVIVGSGIAHSALRATRFDPMGRVFGSSENFAKIRIASSSPVS